MRMTIAIPSHLSDSVLIAEVARCARDERHATAQLVAHLAELDLRRLYLGAGHSSLFAYCRDGLGLSDDAAYNRVEAARACRLFPRVLEQLVVGEEGPGAGAVTLSGRTHAAGDGAGADSERSGHDDRSACAGTDSARSRLVAFDRFDSSTGRAVARHRPLRDPLHRECCDARQAEGGTGSPAERAPRW
jgi:hypothetical protein